jgi:hypothetical protein
MLILNYLLFIKNTSLLNPTSHNLIPNKKIQIIKITLYCQMQILCFQNQIIYSLQK